MNRKLYKSDEDMLVVGVCGGLAEYLDLDPTLVRVAWVLLCAAGGSGVLAYLIAALLMPCRREE
ncbi:MAG: PspC domain-containing protein [Aristaeellaceae bacterium]